MRLQSRRNLRLTQAPRPPVGRSIRVVTVGRKNLPEARWLPAARWLPEAGLRLTIWFYTPKLTRAPPALTFIESVRNDREPAVPATSGRLATEWVLHIYANNLLAR